MAGGIPAFIATITKILNQPTIFFSFSSSSSSLRDIKIRRWTEGGGKKRHREDVGGVAENVLQGPARAAATERDELRRRQRMGRRRRD